MKRILLSLVLMVAAVGTVAGVTASYFSSTATSTDNTFATGIMSIKLQDSDQGPSGTVAMSFGGTGLAPGSVIPQQVLNIINDGNLTGNHLDMEVALSGDTDLAKYIVFTGSNGLRFGADQTGPGSVRFDVANYTAGDLEYGVRDGNSPADYLYGPLGPANGMPVGAGGGMDRDLDGRVTLNDLVGKTRILPGTVNAGIAAGTTAYLWMNSTVDPLMGDSMQGKSVTATFTWTLHQDASQF